MKKSSTLTPARTRKYAALLALLTLMAFAASGCATTKSFRIVKDGGGVVVASSLICPGTKYRLTLSQGSVNASVDVVAGDGIIRFGGAALAPITLTQPVTVTVVVLEAGPDCDLSVVAVGRAFEANNVTPTPVADAPGTFEVGTSRFRAKPQQPQ